MLRHVRLRLGHRALVFVQHSMRHGCLEAQCDMSERSGFRLPAAQAVVGDALLQHHGLRLVHVRVGRLQLGVRHGLAHEEGILQQRQHIGLRGLGAARGGRGVL